MAKKFKNEKIYYRWVKLILGFILRVLDLFKD